MGGGGGVEKKMEAMLAAIPMLRVGGNRPRLSTLNDPTPSDAVCDAIRIKYKSMPADEDEINDKLDRISAYDPEESDDPDFIQRKTLECVRNDFAECFENEFTWKLLQEIACLRFEFGELTPLEENVMWTLKTMDSIPPCIKDGMLFVRIPKIRVRV